jgi:hypothetical protein
MGLLFIYMPMIHKYIFRLNQIENGIADIRLWMISHKLKLNDEKTEIFILSTPSQSIHVNCGNIVIGDSFVASAPSAKMLLKC